MPRYELNIREIINYDHKVIIDSDMSKEELDNLLDRYIGTRNSLNDVLEDGIKFGLSKELTVISVHHDTKGEPDEAVIDDIEEMD